MKKSRQLKKSKSYMVQMLYPPRFEGPSYMTWEI